MAIDDLLGACSGLAGNDLLDSLEQRLGYRLTRDERQLLTGTDGSAAQMYAALAQAVADPCALPGRVAVGVAGSLRGIAASHVLVLGMVDGYTPCHQAVDDNETHDKRAKRAQEERRAFLATLGQAIDDVRLSGFSETDLETAERTKLDIGRIFVRKARRLATAKPSAFLMECEEGVDR